ncbi:MAG TPA: trypsin-like peptidase domain-containing protein [Luteolibacter sp.]|nr:trypsin-like peptidase domain-containing protein [Luteolibacter sp.]
MMSSPFHRSILLCLLLGAGPLIAGPAIKDIGDLSALEGKVQAVAAKVQPLTVALISERAGSSGSGVVVAKDGLILTAAHVVQGADEMQVIFPDGKKFTGKVLGANYSKDVAMVRIIGDKEWPALEFGQSKSLEAGDWVVALGHSAGFDARRPPPVRFGRVISKGPGNFLTTDCTLIGGDSGGPLFDLDGRLVGIHSSIGTALANNNHAGIDGLRDDWDRLLEGQTWGKLTLNPFANPEMPVLGIGMGIVRGVKGVLVDSVVQRSPAAAAGVQPGDLIVSLDGNPILQAGELLQLLAKRQAGDEVKLGIVRDIESQEFKVRLIRRNDLFEEP